MPGQEAVYEMLKQVYDPEVGINIVDMGLIYGVEIEGKKIDLIMTLTSPACPAGPHILNQVDSMLKEMEGIEDVDIRVVGRHHGVQISCPKRPRTSLAFSRRRGNYDRSRLH